MSDEAPISPAVFVSFPDPSPAEPPDGYILRLDPPLVVLAGEIVGLVPDQP